MKLGRWLDAMWVKLVVDCVCRFGIGRVRLYETRVRLGIRSVEREVRRPNVGRGEQCSA